MIMSEHAQNFIADVDVLYNLPENGSAFDEIQPWLNFTNFLQYYDSDTYQLTRLHESIGVLVAFGLTFVTGVFGNALVVYVVLRHGAMKTVTNLFFVNLAVADLLFLALCVPFTAVTYVMPHWPFGNITCKCVNYLMVVSMTSGVMTLTAMGVDRYLAVVRPVHSRAYRTVKHTVVLLASIWAINLITMFPVATISRLEALWDMGSLRSYCVVYFNSAPQRRAYTLSLFLIYYVAPLLIIGLCYFLMAKNLLTTVRPGARGEAVIRLERSRRKVAKMVMMVVATFAICWLPIHCVHLRSDFGPSHYSYSSYVAQIVAHCMSYVNSAINPLIYSFMSKNFRQCFRLAFCCHKPTTGVNFAGVDRDAENISSSTPQKGSKTKTSSEPRTPRDLFKEFNLRMTSPPRPPLNGRQEALDVAVIGSVL